VWEQWCGGQEVKTRNALDCDQSNYSPRIVFPHTVPVEFGQTGNSAIRSADFENPTVEPNIKWIGRPFAEICPFDFFPNVRSVVGRSPVGPGIYNIKSKILKEISSFYCSYWNRCIILNLFLFVCTFCLSNLSLFCCIIV